MLTGVLVDDSSDSTGETRAFVAGFKGWKMGGGSSAGTGAGLCVGRGVVLGLMAGRFGETCQFSVDHGTIGCPRSLRVSVGCIACCRV